MNSLPRPSFSILSCRTQPRVIHPAQWQPKTQLRNASSNRRSRKMLNIPPASTIGDFPLQNAASGRSRTAQTPLPPGDHIVFNPPSSAPNVYHTPPKFLPRTDARWKLWEQTQLQHQSAPISQSSQPSLSSIASSSIVSTPATSKAQPQLGSLNHAHYWPDSQPLPPPVRPPYEKQYHLEPPQIEEMRRLRQSDEETWTRQRLADKFQCSPFFVGMVVGSSEERKKRLREEEKKFLLTWRKRGVSSLKTRRERKKRRALWGVEA